MVTGLAPKKATVQIRSEGMCTQDPRRSRSALSAKHQKPQSHEGLQGTKHPKRIPKHPKPKTLKLNTLNPKHPKPYTLNGPKPKALNP